MAVRTSMYNLIDRVQGLVNDLPTVRGAGDDGAVFTAQDVQDALDRYVERYRQTNMEYELTYANGATITYNDYIAPFNYGDWEEDAVFQDAGYNVITPDTSEWIVGHWHFNTSHFPPVYMAVGKTYDVFAAASYLLREWAAKLKLDFNASQAGTMLNREAKLRMVLQMAGEYDAKRRPQHIRMRRTDLGNPVTEQNWQWRVSARTPRNPSS